MASCTSARRLISPARSSTGSSRNLAPARRSSPVVSSIERGARVTAERKGISLEELARRTGAELVGGDPADVVDRVAILEGATAGAVSFLANPRYRRFLAKTQATAVVLSPNDREACPTAALVAANPYLVFARVAQL